MKAVYRVLLYMTVMVISFVIMFNVISDFKAKEKFDKKNDLCIQITDEMNREINDSSLCTNYYCYYARYTPPEGFESKTETLCICDCKTVDGGIVSTQILNTAHR